MLHRFNARGAPKVFIPPVFAVVLLAGAAALFLTGQPLLAVAGLAVAGWISYHLIRYTVYQFQSYVTTSDDELVCRTSMGVENRMEWSDISHAGTFRTDRTGLYLFVYNESEDELLTVPPYYSDRHSLEQEIKTRSKRFLNLSGRTPEDIGEALRNVLEDD